MGALCRTVRRLYRQDSHHQRRRGGSIELTRQKPLLQSTERVQFIQDLKMSDFPGFPPETRQFLRELRENNTREWFADNKPRYEEFVKAPAIHWLFRLQERFGGV